MALADHIRELRMRLFRAALGIALGTVLGYIFFGPVWHVLKQPYCRVPQRNLLPGHHNDCQLFFNGLFDAFFLKLKIAIILGLIISSPVWFYQLWAFIVPGLKKHERKWGYTFVAAAVPLFVGGAVLAYFTMDKALRLLLGMAPSDTTALITINSYLRYAVSMVLIFGVAFELPLLVVILNLAGVLTHERIKKWRRGLIFAIFCFAAVATPSPDPWTMCIMAVPTVALFEAAEVIAFFHDRRKAAKEAASQYAHFDDDEASPLDLSGR